MELAASQGMQLVGMKQGDLEGCSGVIEEGVEGKAYVVLVGGVRRVGGQLEAENRGRGGAGGSPEVGMHAQLGIKPTATKEGVKGVKAAYEKMVFGLHPDKNKNN